MLKYIDVEQITKIKGHAMQKNLPGIAMIHQKVKNGIRLV